MSPELHAIISMGTLLGALILTSYVMAIAWIRTNKRKIEISEAKFKRTQERALRYIVQEKAF